jgi:hypothetical protein
MDMDVLLLAGTVVATGVAATSLEATPRAGRANVGCYPPGFPSACPAADLPVRGVIAGAGAGTAGAAAGGAAPVAGVAGCG